MLSQKRINQIYKNVYEKIELINIFEPHSVLFEKLKEPTEIITTEEEYVHSLSGSPNLNPFTLLWYNEYGQLHNDNDMPARIIATEYNFSVEWFKNVTPYRKNMKPNKIECLNTSLFYTTNKKTVDTILMWLNKNGQLHSYNGMPAKITKNSIEWWWNGEHYRMSNLDDLPCCITNLGTMTFRQSSSDVSAQIKGPIATRYYGEACKVGLSMYERYVPFPIRQILTV